MLQKNNGVLLKIDSLGRIVIPSKFREILDIKKNKYLIMSLEDDNIKISKYDDSDYLELVNDKFCNIWIENNKKDTIIVTDLYEVKCVLGNNENKILAREFDDNFSYKNIDSLDCWVALLVSMPVGNTRTISKVPEAPREERDLLSIFYVRSNVLYALCD